MELEMHDLGKSGDFGIFVRYELEQQGQQRDVGRLGFAARIEDLRDNASVQWAGPTREALLEWLQGQLREMLPAGPWIEMSPGEAGDAGNGNREATHMEPKQSQPGGEGASLHIEPMDMEFVDLALQEADAPVGKPSGLIEASGRLRVYADAEDATAPMPFRVEFVLVNLDNEQSQTAAIENGNIEPGEFAREIRRQFPIPGKGRYRINAVVRKTPTGEIVASSQGPVLRVVD